MVLRNLHQKLKNISKVLYQLIKELKHQHLKGEWDGIEKSAPEATKHVDGSVDAKIGMGLGVKAKEGAWDKISVPQAADAKKHVTMGEGLTLNGITFKPMVETVKKK
jgi:hypothetical protein